MKDSHQIILITYFPWLVCFIIFFLLNKVLINYKNLINNLIFYKSYLFIFFLQLLTLFYLLFYKIIFNSFDFWIIFGLKILLYYKKKNIIELYNYLV